MPRRAWFLALFPMLAFAQGAAEARKVENDTTRLEAVIRGLQSVAMQCATPAKPYREEDWFDIIPLQPVL
mgnify:CR=1 FL=1